MSRAHPTLLVAPELGFTVLEVKLASYGWALQEKSADPLIPGEPEWAIFRHDIPGRRLHYSFNPVATLRRLEIHGDGAVPDYLELAAGLPGVDWVRARTFLRSANPRDQWLGILAAEHLQDVRLRPLIETLAEQGEPRIAAVARHALSSYAQSDPQLLQAWQAMVTEQQRRPELNVLFRRLPDVELKRQVLRWTALGAASGAGVERLLRTALADDDPEVRVTAMLVAARLRQRNLIEQLRYAQLPDQRGEGAPPGDRLYYRRLQRLAANYLAVPDGVALEGIAARRRDTFEAALQGDQPIDSDETLLWHALLTPLDLGKPPTRLPTGVAAAEDGYSLDVPGGTVPLRWIDHIPHWLGADGSGEPIRRLAPAAGFFISTFPLSTDPGHDDRPWTGTFDAANARVEGLAARTVLPLRLPTADEWEMAARGPDGRCYPWGSGLQPNWSTRSSPWGVGGWGTGEEWTLADIDRPTPTVVGGREPQPAARRRDPGSVRSAAVRVVLPA